MAETTTPLNFVDINGNDIEEQLHATISSHGLMCPEDKVKLAGIEEGATKTIISTITIPRGRMRGDINGDGKITQADVDLLSAYVFDPSTAPLDDTQLLCADVNANGSINGTDTLQLRQYLSNIKKAGQFGAEVTNNWTNNPNYDTEDGQFYTDISITGMTVNHSAYVIVNGVYESGLFTKAECIEGAIRIYAKLCPIEALTAVVSWGTGDGTAAITTERDESEVFIANYGITTSTEIEIAYQAGKLVLCKQNNLIYTLTKRSAETWHSFSGHVGKNAIRYVTCNADVWSYEQPNFVPEVSDGGGFWAQSNITDIDFNCIYYANGIWVAGSDCDTGLYYSTDGKTWTQSNITSGDFECVYNANGIWVAGSAYYGDEGLYYSTDGMTWIQSNITSGYFMCLYNANGIWVAGGSSKGLYYSTDGMTWTQSNITSDSYFNNVYNANGIWVAGSDYGLYYSTDGMTWTQSNITSGRFYCVYNANGIWVAGSNSFDGIYYSTDGITWTQSNVTNIDFECVYNANGIWVAVGDGIYYSIDGMTWTQSNITNYYSFYCVYYGNGIWVAGSNSNNGLYYSTDGKTWTQSNITNIDFECVYNANGIWVAGSGNYSSKGLYYSVTSDTGKILTVDSDGNASWELGTQIQFITWKEVGPV